MLPRFLVTAHNNRCQSSRDQWIINGDGVDQLLNSAKRFLASSGILGGTLLRHHVLNHRLRKLHGFFRVAPRRVRQLLLMARLNGPECKLH